jgi:uncharacterized protein YbcV (DUF1398 family)
MEKEVNKNCLACRKKQIKLVRYIYGVISQNITYACENKDCVLFLNVEKIKNWKKV